MDAIKNLFKSKTEKSPDEDLSITEIITSKNFKVESHTIQTQDGYLLTIYHIPPLTESQKSPPILFQHGLLDSSDGWVCNTKERSLPFILSSKNYDIWISNSRGNKHSKKHIKYSDKDFEFWQFSLHDMGLYDLPSILEYIMERNKSGERIIYFGHSQGTAMLFAALTTQCDYFRQYIKLFVALAPIARITHMSSNILTGLENFNAHEVLKLTKFYEILPEDKSSGYISSFFNKNFSWLTNFGLSLVCDEKSSEDNDQKQLGVFLKHFPSGTSLKTLIHFVSIYKHKEFVHYDYGKEANMFIYGQREPVIYDLSKINDFPIMLVCGEDDMLATPNDVKWLYEQIKNNVIYFNIFPNMGHASFLIGKDILWFNSILDIIETKFKFCDEGKNFYKGINKPEHKSVYG
jgi:lysosomal acid lipase/cholesteryl ester hydrolase